MIRENLCTFTNHAILTQTISKLSLLSTVTATDKSPNGHCAVVDVSGGGCGNRANGLVNGIDSSSGVVVGIVEDFGVLETTTTSKKKKSKQLLDDVDIRKRIELLTKPLESEKELKRKKKESVFVQRRRERQLSVETEVLLSSSFILYLT